MRFCCNDIEKVNKIANEFEDLLNDLIWSIERTCLGEDEKETARKYGNHIAHRLNNLKLLSEQVTIAHLEAMIPHTNKII